jgi:hypothetical protein
MVDAGQLSASVRRKLASYFLAGKGCIYFVGRERGIITGAGPGWRPSSRSYF